MKVLECKVRETMDVEEETLTALINEMSADGYQLDAIHFAMRESSKRPSMAFLVFYRTSGGKKNPKPPVSLVE